MATFLEDDNRALHPCRMQHSLDREHNFVLQYLQTFRINPSFSQLHGGLSAVA